MKGIDALVLAAGPPKPDKGGDDMPGESSGGAGVRAFRALRRALETRDDSAGYAAARHLVGLCQGNDEPDADDMGEAGGDEKGL